MHKVQMLKALKADEACGPLLKDRVLAACRVYVIKGELPAEKEEPDATDEAPSNAVEVNAVTTLGEALHAARCAGDRLFIRVETVSSSPDYASARTERSLPEEWSDLLKPEPSVDKVYERAASVAASALRDVSLTVDELASLWGAPATSDVLQKPLPFDYPNKNEGSVMLELIESVHGSSATAATILHERVWDLLKNAFKSTQQRTSAVLLTGVSGAGKTKVAFDIGTKYAFVVMARVYEQGKLTDPWKLLERVTEKLLTQSLRRSEGYTTSTPSTADADSAMGAMLLLLSCHLEWAATVFSAAVRADPTLATTEEGKRVLRQVILRAQRTGTGNRAVSALFAARLLEVLTASSDGYVTVAIEAAKQRLEEVSQQLPLMPVVWCYDEVQVLLTHDAFCNFFSGTYKPSDVEGAVSSVSATPLAEGVAETPLGLLAPSVTTQDLGLSYPAAREDIDACNAELRRSCSRGWFYGLLVAMRHVIDTLKSGHLLCGSSLRLNRELLLAHSPAQGVCESIDADVHLDAVAIRRWFEAYVTPAAAAGLDDALIAKLAGRPLYASYFFQELYKTLDATLSTQDPKEVVATALRKAVAAATRQAFERVTDLWVSHFSTACGEQPQTLVAWLYYIQRMGLGTTTTITPPSMSSEVMEAVQRGVLHVGRNVGVVDLSQEPVTAKAIMDVGDLRTSPTSHLLHDSVLLALSRRAAGLFGDDSSKGTTAEDVLAWTLLKHTRSADLSGSAIDLSDLLGPFIDPKAGVLQQLKGHTVQLRGGLQCGSALHGDGPGRTFLELLAAPGGSELLLHRTQTKAAGADLAFLVQRPGGSNDAPRRQRLVLLQVKNGVKATAADMLRSVDLGTWYPDEHVEFLDSRGRKQVVRVETAAHVAFRELMARHPDWTDPIRVLVSARPWSQSAHETAARVNIKVRQQPLVLAQITTGNLGVKLEHGEVADSEVNPPQEDKLWWPSRIRHWRAGTSHPQSTLPAPPGTTVKARRVRFFAGSGRDLRAEAGAAGTHAVIEETTEHLIVQYKRLGDARRAVQTAEIAAAKASGSQEAAPVWAAFDT